ncbi:MAG: glycosyltransferase [Candidatus Woesearchaeota archaeon]
MKVCIITFEYPPTKGGIGLACQRIARTLSEELEIHIITTNPGNPNIFYNQEEMNTIEKEGNITIHRLGPSCGFLVNVPAQELQNMFDYISALQEKEQFDVFHGFRVHPSGYIATLLGKQFNKRSIVSIRGDDIAKDIFHQGFFSIIRWTLENAHTVTSVATDILKRAQLIADIKRPVTILNSLNPRDFFYKEGIGSKQSLAIGTVGEIRRKKGFAYLLKAFAQLKKEHDPKLMIVGFFRPEEEKTYLDMIKEAGCESEIIVTGKVEKKLILNYIKNLDIAVFPALSEGCPNAVLETMYCKRPIIASRVGAMPEIINQDNGILIDPRSPEQIYESIKRLIEDPELKKKLAENAKNTIKKNHKPSDEKKKWLEVYG